MPGTTKIKNIEFLMETKKGRETYFVNNLEEPVLFPGYPTKGNNEILKQMIVEIKKQKRVKGFKQVIKPYVMVMGYNENNNPIVNTYPLEYDSKNQSLIINTLEEKPFSKVEFFVPLRKGPAPLTIAVGGQDEETIENGMRRILDGNYYRQIEGSEEGNKKKFHIIAAYLKRYPKKITILAPVRVPNGVSVAPTNVNKGTISISQSGGAEYIKVMRELGKLLSTFSAELENLKDRKQIANNIVVKSGLDLNLADGQAGLALNKIRAAQEQLKEIEKLFDEGEILKLDGGNVKDKLVEFKRAFDEEVMSKISSVIPYFSTIEISAFNTALEDLGKAFNKAYKSSPVQSSPTPVNAEGKEFHGIPAILEKKYQKPDDVSQKTVEVSPGSTEKNEARSPSDELSKNVLQGTAGTSQVETNTKVIPPTPQPRSKKPLLSNVTANNNVSFETLSDKNVALEEERGEVFNEIMSQLDQLANQIDDQIANDCSLAIEEETGSNCAATDNNNLPSNQTALDKIPSKLMEENKVPPKPMERRKNSSSSASKVVLPQGTDETISPSQSSSSAVVSALSSSGKQPTPTNDQLPNNVQPSSRNSSGASIILEVEGGISSFKNYQPQAEAKRPVWKKVLIGMGIGLGIATVVTATAGALLLTGGTAAAPIIAAGAAVGHFLGITSVTVSLASMGAALMSAGSAIGGLMGGVVARFQSRRVPTVAKTEIPWCTDFKEERVANLSPATVPVSTPATAAENSTPPATPVGERINPVPKKPPRAAKSSNLKRLSSSFRSSVRNVHHFFQKNQNTGNDATLNVNEQQRETTTARNKWCQTILSTILE